MGVTGGPSHPIKDTAASLWARYEAKVQVLLSLIPGWTDSLGSFMPNHSYSLLLLFWNHGSTTEITHVSSEVTGKNLIAKIEAP